MARCHMSWCAISYWSIYWMRSNSSTPCCLILLQGDKTEKKHCAKMTQKTRRRTVACFVFDINTWNYWWCVFQWRISVTYFSDVFRQCCKHHLLLLGTSKYIILYIVYCPVLQRVILTIVGDWGNQCTLLVCVVHIPRGNISSHYSITLTLIS